MKRAFPLIIIMVLSIAAWIYGVHGKLNVQTLLMHQDMIAAFIEQNTLQAIFIFMGIYIVAVALSIPGASFLTITGGYFFGQTLGTGAVVIAATIGASLLYFSVRMATQTYMQQKAGPWLSAMQRGFQNSAGSYLLTLRLIPLFPFFAVNLVAAALHVRFFTFFFATLIGIIPGTFVYVAMGVALREAVLRPNITPQFFLEPKIMVALVGLGLLALLPAIYKRIRYKRQLRMTDLKK